MAKILAWVGPLLLCAEEVARLPGEIPGIYLLHAFDPASGYYPSLYVGKTHDLRARLLRHLESDSTSPDIRLARARVRIYFSAAPVLDAAQRDAAEAGLIRLLRPPCNRQVPRALPVYPNLPPMLVTF